MSLLNQNNGSKRNCCVVGCYNNERKNPELQFYCFPKQWWLIERREKWIAAVRRMEEDGKPWMPTNNSRICSAHFQGGEKSENPAKEAYNPTIFPDIYKKKVSTGKREKRLQNRNDKKGRVEEMLVSQLEFNIDEPVSTGTSIAIQTDFYEDVCNENITTLICNLNESKNEAGTLAWISIKTQDNEIPKITVPSVEKKDQQTETSISGKYFGFTGFPDVNSDEVMKQLTGITLSFYAILLNFIVPGLNGQPTSFKKVSRENRLLIFLMKMKLGLTFGATGCLFGVSEKTASSIFYSVLETLLINTNTWLFWPSKEAIKESMPIAFKNYPNCRAIIDCTELRCESPGTVENRVLMYSSYKGGFTIKFLIAISPCGLITFISKCYGGRSTDAYITNDSGFLELIESGDEVMADKGFPQIRSELINRQCTLVMPPFGFNPQFTREEILEGYSIASVRIHVERAIQRVKIFKILQYISHDLFPHIDKIVRMACILANNKEPLIRK